MKEMLDNNMVPLDQPLLVQLLVFLLQCSKIALVPAQRVDHKHSEALVLFEHSI